MQLEKYAPDSLSNEKHKPLCVDDIDESSSKRKWISAATKQLKKLNHDCNLMGQTYYSRIIIKHINEAPKVQMPRWNDTNTTIHHSTNTATADAWISVQQSQCSALVMQSEANQC